MWNVYLQGNPRWQPGTGLRLQSAVVGVVVERPIAFRSGIFIETYKVYDVGDHSVFARYTGLRRSPELPRKFDPARLC